MGMAYIRVRSTDINAVNTASGTTVKGSYDSSIRILGLQYSQSF